MKKENNESKGIDVALMQNSLFFSKDIKKSVREIKEYEELATLLKKFNLGQGDKQKIIDIIDSSNEG